MKQSEQPQASSAINKRAHPAAADRADSVEASAHARLHCVDVHSGDECDGDAHQQTQYSLHRSSTCCLTEIMILSLMNNQGLHHFGWVLSLKYIVGFLIFRIRGFRAVVYPIYQYYIPINLAFILDFTLSKIS